jgi:hypothetical protein
MKSALRGKCTLGAEVTQVSTRGLWVLLDDQEVFAAFDDFPWFRDATIGQLTRVERPSPHHLYWPDLDVDLAVESLGHPERYPLVSRARPNKRLQPTKARRRTTTKSAKGQEAPRLRG